MSDDVNPNDAGDEPSVRDIEALLRELDVDDLEPIEPPAEVWAAIDQRVSATATAPVVALADRRKRVVGWVLASAAALVLLVVGVVALTGGDDDSDVVSSAVLAFDPASFDPRGADAAAEAQLIGTDGSYSIRLTDTQFPQLGEDDLELWLIEPDADGNPVDVAPVSLIDADGDGTYEVPPGLDPTSHYVVDISIEPRDGDATHSGQSILRGPLEPVSA